jgi:hypothetical protein
MKGTGGVVMAREVSLFCCSPVTCWLSFVIKIGFLSIFARIAGALNILHEFPWQCLFTSWENGDTVSLAYSRINLYKENLSTDKLQLQQKLIFIWKVTNYDCRTVIILIVIWNILFLGTNLRHNMYQDLWAQTALCCQVYISWEERKWRLWVHTAS